MFPTMAEYVKNVEECKLTVLIFGGVSLQLSLNKDMVFMVLIVLSILGLSRE